ncbi:MAG: deoxyribonuclease V [Firmicutes bacterium]|nr:deoxyribonuclease V [Bacillota bacterium]
MNDRLLHKWDVDLNEARKIQERLSKHLVLEPYTLGKCMVAGIDVSFRKSTQEASAAIAVMSYPQLRIIEISIARMKMTFPYIPGYLAFREAPAILEAWAKLKTKPNLLVFDGQGLAHPRRFGLACHLGVIFDLPAIGCAKSHLYGDFVEPAQEKGAYSHIIDPAKQDKIGAAVRTRNNVSCVYISPGNHMDIESAVRTIFSLTHRYRLPEPIRYAHKYSGKGWEE